VEVGLQDTELQLTRCGDGSGFIPRPFATKAPDQSQAASMAGNKKKKGHDLAGARNGARLQLHDHP
jgi:hypothetical protein